MKLPLYETRAEWALAVFLALIAGYLDGYGLLVLGTYVSFMSGNTAFTGLQSGQHNFSGSCESARSGECRRVDATSLARQSICVFRRFSR